GAPGNVTPAYSKHGLTWTEIPRLTGKTLPAGYVDGYYRDSVGTLHVLTLHATYFGLLRAGTKLTPALVLPLSAPHTLKLASPHPLRIGTRTTLPSALSVTLARGTHTVAVWKAAGKAGGVVKLALPKSALAPGSYTARVTAVAGANRTAQTA